MINALIVDDSEEILEVLSLNFQIHPSIESIWTAQTSQEARDVCRTENVDLISIDIHLGNQDGFELCQEIRQAYPQMFVTMCSMACDKEDMLHANQCGANYFLAKPISLEDLNALVHEYRAFHEAPKKTSPEAIDLLKLLKME